MTTHPSSSVLLDRAIQQIQKSSGVFASDWTSFFNLIRESSDLLSLLSSTTQNHQKNETIDSKNDNNNNGVTSCMFLFEGLKSVLFRSPKSHQQKQMCCFDPNSGPLFEMFFSLMYQLLVSDKNNNHNSLSQFVRQQEKLNEPEVVAEYFRFALSLPIGERFTKNIFLLVEKFANVLIFSPSCSNQNGGEKEDKHKLLLDLITGKDEQSSTIFFTRMNLAIALAREEKSSWPLRRENDSNCSSGSKASLFQQWSSIILRRLSNPLCFPDENPHENKKQPQQKKNLLFGFVSLPLRQMLVSIPQRESAHVLAFLVLVVFSSSTTTSITIASWKKFLMSCLAILTQNKNICLQTSTFVPTPELVSKFPSICAMIELVSAFSSSSPKNDLESFSCIVSRLKKTTEQICENISSSKTDNNNNNQEGKNYDADDQNTVTFSWLMNLWIAIAADFFSSSSSNNNKNDTTTPGMTTTTTASTNNNNNNSKLISTLIKDMKKSFRLPGKMATEAESGDALFFSEWATAEQLLFGETKMQPEIFKQAVSIPSSRNDPTGAPLLVRAAAQLFQSQRAEGAAGTVLERAVDRSTSSASGTSAAIPGTPLGVDVALWSAFSDFISEQNGSFAAGEDIEQRKRHAMYSVGSHLTQAPVEETSRRVNPTPSDIYLCNLRQLSLGGGLVLPNSGASNGGEVAWSMLFRDVEIARRSSVTVGETGGGASLPCRLPMQNITGFPSLQGFGANPARLPLPSLINCDKNKKNSCSFDDGGRGGDSALTLSSLKMVMPEFIFGNENNSNNNNRRGNLSETTTTATTRIRWDKLEKMPENPVGAIEPYCPPESLNDVTGPQRLRPIQRLIIDKNTAARLERENLESKRRSRTELLQSLASEALIGLNGGGNENNLSHNKHSVSNNNNDDDAANSAATATSTLVQILESLPEYLLKLTKSAALANTTLQQLELEDSLTQMSGSAPTVPSQTNFSSTPGMNETMNSRFVGGFRIPTSDWLIERMQMQK